MEQRRKLRPLTIASWCAMIGGVALTTISSIIAESGQVGFYDPAFTTYLLLSIAGIVITLAGFVVGMVYWVASWVRNHKRANAS